jgi:hypothetical protein
MKYTALPYHCAMSERNVGLEILEGIREIKAFKRGELELKSHELSEPSSPKVDSDEAEDGNSRTSH